MERVAIIRPPESSLPLAGGAGYPIGPWCRTISPLSAHRKGEDSLYFIPSGGRGGPGSSTPSAGVRG